MGIEYLQWEYNRTHNGNRIFTMGIWTADRRMPGLKSDVSKSKWKRNVKELQARRHVLKLMEKRKQMQRIQRFKNTEKVNKMSKLIESERS